MSALARCKISDGAKNRKRHSACGLKAMMASAPILMEPRFDGRPLLCLADCMGCVIAQYDDEGAERPVLYVLIKGTIKSREEVCDHGQGGVSSHMGSSETQTPAGGIARDNAHDNGCESLKPKGLANGEQAIPDKC